MSEPIHKKIFESEYGESLFNFHVTKHGNELHVDLTYPPWEDKDNINGQCRYICVNQEAVRASDGLRLYYDYKRDGFVVQQPRPYMTKIDKNSYDSHEDWIEVGFFESWKFDVDMDQQFADADAKI